MDDRRMLLLSILYQLVRWLLGLTTVLVRRDLSKDAELLVLRHENTVLRRQISRVRYRPVDRAWLTALSQLVPGRRWAKVFPVTPAMILAWHRKLVSRRWDGTVALRRRAPSPCSEERDETPQAPPRPTQSGHLKACQSASGRATGGDWVGRSLNATVPNELRKCNAQRIHEVFTDRLEDWL
jgi:hypothetical protein